MKNCLFILILTLFTVSSTIASSGDSLYYFGTQTHFGQLFRTDVDSVTMEATLDLIYSAGIRTIRDEVYWSDVEKTKGVFNFDKQHDNYVRASLRRGIQVLIILDYNNELYSTTSAVTTDSNRLAYARYCQEVVSHYFPMGVKHYEIWNEPNIKIFWDPPNASDYAKLLKVAYPAIKQVNPNAVVIVGSTSPSENNPPIQGFIDWVTYFNDLKTAGGLDSLDVVSFHLYRVDRGPESWLAKDIQTIQSIVGTTKLLWITEVGFPTSSVWPNLSQQSQANYIARMYLLGRAYSQLQRIVYYDFRNDGDNPADNEANFGLVNHNLTTKPAYIALKNVIELTGSKVLNSSSVFGATNIQSYGTEDERILALWNSSTTESRALNVGSLYSQLMDRDGKKIAYFIGDSIITVTLTTAPQYIGTLPSHPPLTKLTLTPKKFLLDTTQSMQMYATATDPANVPASIPHRLVQWKVIGTSGLIDTNGLFRALKPGNATITATYRGLSDSVTVTISAPSGSILIDDFNSPITFSLSTQNLDTTKTTFSISSEQSSNGTTSGKLYYEFTLKSGIPLLNYRAFLNADLMFIGKPDTLYVDVFGNGETHVVGFTFQDFSGRQSIKYAADQSVTWNGIWKTVKYALKGWIPVIEYPLTLKQLFLVIRTSKTVYDSTYKGTIYFDNLRTFYGTPTAIENLPLIPTHTMLMQNYPNPFNPKTAISYQLLANRHTLLKVLDVLGREVTTLVNEMKPPGKYIVTWDASKYPSGTYFYRLHTETNIETKRMVLVK